MPKDEKAIDREMIRIARVEAGAYLLTGRLHRMKAEALFSLLIVA